MEDRHISKDSTEEPSLVQREEDDESWVDIESLTSLDTVGEAGELVAPQDGSDYGASDSEADAADAFFSQTRAADTGPPFKPSTPPTPNTPLLNDKGPKWWRLCKRIYETVAHAAVQMVRRSRASVLKLMSPGITVEQKMSKVQPSHKMSNGAERAYSLLVTLIACLGVFVQGRALYKSFHRKDHQETGRWWIEPEFRG